MRENNGLPVAPILVVNRSAIFYGYGARDLFLFGYRAHVALLLEIWFFTRRLSGGSRKIFSRLLWRVAFAQATEQPAESQGRAGYWSPELRGTIREALRPPRLLRAHHSVPRLLCSSINQRGYLFRLFQHCETAMFRKHEGGIASSQAAPLETQMPGRC